MQLNYLKSQKLKSGIKNVSGWLVPPKISHEIIKLTNRLLRRGWYFSGRYASWAAAERASNGYDNPIILERVLSAAVLVKNGEAVYERDGVIFNKIEFSWPTLSALMSSAAENSGDLSVLDFGGSLGTSFFQNRYFLDRIKKCQWNVVEQSHFVKAGNHYIADENIKFFYRISDVFSECTPNVALFSGVLDLISDPYSVLEEVCSKRTHRLVIDRSAFLNDHYDNGADEYVIQCIGGDIFSTRLPFRHLSMKKLLWFLESHGYSVVSEFSAVGGGDTRWSFKGLIAEFNV